MEARLNSHGIFSIETLCGLSKDRMLSVWGGIVGARFYELIRGENLDLPKSKTHSIGHQHVLAPDSRTRDGAVTYLKRLASKAAFRLRKNQYFTRKIGIEVKYQYHSPSFWVEKRIEETQSTLVLLKILDDIAKQILPEKPLRVGIVLSDLIPAENHQLTLFHDGKVNEISSAMDNINEKFGNDAIFFGGVPPQTETKSKIAFSRIPEEYEL